MFTPTRVAVAAVLGVLLIGGAFVTIDRLGQPAVGVPGPSATPSPSPAASPSATALTQVPMPEVIWGDWQAEPAEAISGVNQAGEQLQLSIAWDGGGSAWIQPPRGDNAFVSTSVVPDAADELRFVSTGMLGGCSLRDEGRYRWARSTDGMFLTLTAIDDACVERATAFGRTWTHSLSAVNDGGPGVVPLGDGRWLQATLPSIQWALGSVGAIDLHSFDESDPRIDFIVIADPRGFETPCGGRGRPAVPIDGAAAELVEYVQSLPGLTVATEAVEIDGRPAIHLDVTSDPAIDCPSGEILAFDSTQTSDDFAWALTPGEPHSFWIVEVDGATQFIWYEGDGVSPADEQAVIDSLRFLDALPTP